MFSPPAELEFTQNASLLVCKCTSQRCRLKRKLPEDWLAKICIVWPGKLGVCCVISISLNQPKLAIHMAYLTPELISRPPSLFLMKNTCAEIAALKASNLWPLSYCGLPLFLTTLRWWRPNLPVWMIWESRIWLRRWRKTCIKGWDRSGESKSNGEMLQWLRTWFQSCG